MVYVKNQYRGIQFERTERDATEKRFAEVFAAECEVGRDTTTATGDFVRQLLCPSDANPNHPPPISDRDRKVVATTIQWLGSPVGQSFLAKALDGKRPTTKKRGFGRRTGRGR